MLDGYSDRSRKLRDLLASRTSQATTDIYAVRDILDAQEPK